MKPSIIHTMRQKATLEMYDSIDAYIKEDIVEASIWARDKLTRRDGPGHIINIVSSGDLVCCCFAKPEWSGDHCGDAMETGAEAIVRAVCEYLCGC